MQTKMFSIRRVTLIAFMMLGIGSLTLMISCNQEQAKPDEFVNHNLRVENTTDDFGASKQPCTPEELQ